jgi:CAAX prenyl protease-like protein
MAGLMLVPAVQLLGGTSLWITNPEYWIYPLQTLLCGMLLVFYRREYDFRIGRGLGLALLVGLAVLGLWIAPQASGLAEPRLGGFNPDVFAASPALYWFTIIARFLRLVVVVPLIEEIFWRGFLMRVIIREDFTSVPFGTFRWGSFLAVAVCFMLVHNTSDWPAALLCGLAFNALAVRTKSLASCIAAHAITNLGLGLYIMATKQWGFW